MRVAIIGAGLAGLSAAFEVRQLVPDATIDVFEATDRIGGKLRTVAFNDGPTDMGAEAFLAVRSDALEFFEQLGIADRVVHGSGLSSLVYSEGALHDLPQGQIMGVPASSESVRALVSAETCALIDAEATAAPIEWQVGGDMSLGELVTSRFGQEVTDRLVSALLGGVYSCLAEDLGVRATIPFLAAALDRLAESGEPVTLSAAVRGLLERRPKPSIKSVFGAFEGGYATLYEALAEQSGADIHIDTFVTSLQKYLQDYDRVLVATPAPTAAVLFKDVCPEASAELRQVQLASSVVVGLKFDSDAGLPEHSGVLVAADATDVKAKAFTFSSKKWPHLGARGGALVRVSFGRFGDDSALRLDEDELVDIALDDLQTVTGFDGRAAGVSEIFVQPWYGGLPRFSETHLETVARVREALADIAHVEVAGAWADGVGVPNVIAGARAAARRLVSDS